MDNEELRRSYRPDKIKILLVGESAPVSGKFFYRKSAMTTFTARVFESVYGQAFEDTADFLRCFKANGCYLDDLSLVPVNAMGPVARGRALRESIQSLAKRIIEMEPQVVVAVLRKIGPHVRQAVQFAGLPIVFRSLPFPGQGHQKKYMAGLESILRRKYSRPSIRRWRALSTDALSTTGSM
jgi:hypothetical protein